jgi:hypothetical protein
MLLIIVERDVMFMRDRAKCKLRGAGAHATVRLLVNASALCR